MTKITLSGGTTIELSAEQLRELGAKIAEAVEGKAEEVPEFNVGDYAVSKGESQHGNIQRDYFVKVEETEVGNDGYTLYVRHQKSRIAGYMRPQDLRPATAGEVAEYEKSRIFTENGRKPNEYRKGDIVIYVGGASVNGMAVEVFKDTEDGITAIKWHDTVGLGVCTEKPNVIKPLVFVEQRLDRKQ